MIASGYDLILNLLNADEALVINGILLSRIGLIMKNRDYFEQEGS